MDFSHLQDNLAAVRERLAAAARRGGYPTPRLMAVTKSADDEAVRALLALDIEAIGENRPQLFCARYDLAAEAGSAAEVHLIGTLQTNKVKYVADKAALIHSLDSDKLAAEIDRQGEKKGRRVPVLIEVNSGREPAKGGVLPEEVLAFAERVAKLSHLSLRGLMTMGPDCEDPADYRPYFRLTRELLSELTARGLLDTDAPVLSMGMSNSYEIAAEEGATIVRVGRQIFRKP